MSRVSNLHAFPDYMAAQALRADPQIQFSLKGRTALVTGGARGCGLAFAQGLAEAGADVAVFDVIEPVPEFHEISSKYGVKTGHYMYV